MMYHTSIKAPALFLLTVITVLVIPAKGLGQTENIIFRNITPDEGLPVTSVISIAQDSFGFIWIGSWEGVYRYDGTAFERMAEQGRYITPDNKGGVWISYDREGPAAYYHPQSDGLKFYEVPAFENSFPRFAKDSSGKIWVDAPEGLYYFDESSEFFVADSLSDSRLGHVGLRAHNNGSLSFFYYEAGVKWGIGTRTAAGNYIYEDFPADLNNPDPTLLFNHSSIPNLTTYRENGLLIINRNGWAFRENYQAEWTFVKPDRADLLDHTSEIISHKQFLFVQQPNGLARFDIRTGASTTYTHNPANSGSILEGQELNNGGQLFIDRQEVLWIPVFSYGISRLNLFESDFGLLRFKDSTPVRDVISVVELEDGSFWVGTRYMENSLYHFDKNRNIIRQLSGYFDSPPGTSVSTDLSHPFVWSLAAGSDGSIWAGTGSPGPAHGGLNRIRPGTDRITRFKHDPDNPASLFPGNWVIEIIEDGSGRIWVKDWRSIAWVDPERDIINQYSHPEKSGVADGDEFYLLKTHTGDLIVSSENNTYYRIRHKDLSIEKIPFIPGIGHEVFIILQDTEQEYWAAGRGGFGQIDSTNWTLKSRYEINQFGFPVTEITSLTNDLENNLWITTDNGIIKFDPATEKAMHYTYQRGLQGHSYSGRLTYTGPSGKVYLGDNGGINIFDPAGIQANPHPPQMVFTGLTLDGNPVPAERLGALNKARPGAEQMTIAPDILTIGIEFAALHFAGNQRNPIIYMLEGFDRNWRDAGTAEQASYTNLPPGTYTFRIKGSNLDGVWSDGSDALQIKVLPPWYRTWWAYGIYILLFAAGVFTTDRYQRRRLVLKEQEKAREKELQQAREIERAYRNLEKAHGELKEAQEQLIQQEKLASLGQLTAGIAHEIKNPLNFVNNFSELSVELIEELRQEIKDKRLKNEDSQPENESIASDEDKYGSITDLINDIEANLNKIHEHGSRADSIVKSMLEHSRGGSGAMEPTDLNALLKEFVNLSFHGMRAGENPINTDISYELHPSVKQVPLIAEDFSRVIINLCNNAFDAMRMKVNSNREAPDSNEYKPRLTIRTITESDKIIIEIEDNGPGIPKEIEDKIMQPFFTTKKGTDGTGLGLSITNDIIKAHGGELRINTNSEGTCFIVQLNTVS